MPQEKVKKSLISNKLYTWLKLIALVINPAIATLYFTLAQIWGLPSAEQVLGTIAAFDAFLGVFIKMGELSYDASDTRYGGVINVEQRKDKKVFSLEVHGDPEDLENKKTVTFKVSPSHAKHGV